MSAGPVFGVVAIAFNVHGIPQTQGSMKAFMPKGARFPVVTHGSKRLTVWRNLVAMEASRVRPKEIWTGPLRMEVVFRMQRPKTHYNKKGVRPSAPALPAGSLHDLDKFIRGVLDALTGVVYRDDGQICEIVAHKEYATSTAGASVMISKLREE